MQWYETTLPLDCSVEFEMENVMSIPNIFYKVLIEDVGKELEVKPDYDGEERMLVLDLQIHVYLRAWQEHTVQLLEDVYSLKQNLQPMRAEVSLERLLLKNDALCKVTEQVELEENQEKILQICSCEGKAHIDRITQQEKGIFVEGTLEIHLLYITTDDQMPVGAAYKLYPFEQLIEVPQTNIPISMEKECHMVQLSSAMLDQSHAEIKAVIGVNVLVFAKESLEQITDIEVTPIDQEKLRQMPGVVGYITKKGDTLWDIAKKYHAAVETIMEINEKTNENLQPNEKLLIIKNL
ncbi:MAG: LysM peptidoglycan-binding domain-containing protein, partial [Lachnospiraceae bacterium]|nr:LysM peptidoglycan-binding domain-containing protein [Lachnospiraceae bacterium]